MLKCSYIKKSRKTGEKSRNLEFCRFDFSDI